MSDDVVRPALPLRLYPLKPTLADFFSYRRDRLLAVYAGYVVLVAAAVVAIEARPPTYEVNAMIDLQPAAYVVSDDQRFRPARADEIARSHLALLTTDTVIRGALADLSRGQRAVDAPALASVATSDDRAPGASSPAVPADISRKRAATSAPVRAPNIYEASAIAVNEATMSVARDVGQLGHLVVLAKNTVWPPLAPADAAFVSAKRAIKAQTEPNTGFIRVSYRHRDPAYAIRFLNALIERFTDKYYELYSNAGAVAFFARHRKESEDEFARASADLAAFSRQNDIFNVDEQRKLLLQERSRLISDLAATRDLRAQEEDEATAMTDQLALMKPLGQYPQITSLAQTSQRLHPGSHSSEGAMPPGKLRAGVPTLPNLASDPPLLLVKVYQDTIANLVKLNTDLAGLRAKQENQQAEIAEFDRKLADMASKESAYERIRQKAELAKATALQFAKKAVDEQVQQDLNAYKLSTVRVVQPPTRPIQPVWPRQTIIAIALLLAILPALAMAGPTLYRRFSFT